MARLSRFFTGLLAVALFVGIAAAPAAATVSVTLNSQPRSFSPNNDGQEDTLDVSYYLTEAANVTVTVYVVDNPNAVKVIETGVSHGAGYQGTVWDGTNTANNVVADGDYYLVIEAAGATNTDQASYDTAVDKSMPGNLTYPSNGQTLSGNQSFSFRTTPLFESNNTVTDVWMTCFGTGTFQFGQWTSSDTPVDTSTCGEGSQTLYTYVNFTDEFGTTHQWNTTITVTLKNPVRAELYYAMQSQSFSPNNDGQEDTVTAYYCISRTSTVDIKVYAASDTLHQFPVRTLIATPDGGGDGLFFTAGNCGWYYYGSAMHPFSWDGKNDANAVVANGDYDIVVHAVDSDNNTASVTFHTAVDSRIPGTITAPASGAQISGSSTPFVFTPTAGFDALNGVSPSTCYGTAPALQGDGAWTATLDAANCGLSTTAIQANVNYYDHFGAYHSWTSPGVAVTAAMHVQIFSGPSSFSPNGDGQDDTFTAYYCINRDAHVTVTVLNGSNQVVKTVESDQEHPAYYCTYVNFNSATWDGTGADGQTVVADGDYTIHVHAVADNDSYATTDDAEIATTVDTRVPGVLTAPASGALLDTEGTFVFTPTNGFDGIDQVSVDCISASAYTPTGGVFTATGSTSGCANGPASLHTYVHWIDNYGVPHWWISPTTVPVTIDNPLGLQALSAPEAFSPNGDGQDDTTTAYYCLARDAHLDAVVKNHAGDVVRTLFTNHPEVANYTCSGHTLDWDGLDANGNPLPDGEYSFAIHGTADVGNATADLTMPISIDARSPGQGTKPTFGQEVSGTVDLEFSPTTGFHNPGVGNTIDYIYACFDYENNASDQCIQIVNASQDGKWRTTTDTLANGEADVDWIVHWHDLYDTAHDWSAPSVPVFVNTTPGPALQAFISSATGDVPLASTLHASMSDPDNRPLSYTVDFGDGSDPLTGVLGSPYTNGLTLPHTYQAPGNFIATVHIDNGAGGTANKTVNVSAFGSNGLPHASLSVSPTNATAPADVTATFSATDNDTPNPNYTLDFGDGSTAVSGTLPDGPVQHTYTTPGTYTVRFSATDGTNTSVRARTVLIGSSEEALDAHAGDDQTAVVNQPVQVDGSASRPLVGITSYDWDYGDGATASGARPAPHSYATTGAKTVTLTIHRGASQDTDTLVVNVLPGQLTHGIHVTVTGGGGPIAGADVLVLDADGVRHPATSGNDGVATITGLTDGNYTVYGYHDGFLPGTANATQTSGDGDTALDLEVGSVAQTSMTSRPLTLQEIIDAGIDINNPDNQNVFEFEIHLAFTAGNTTSDVAFSGHTTSATESGPGHFYLPSFGGGGGGDGCIAASLCVSIDGGGGSGGGYAAYPSVSYTGGVPTIIWMVIPGKAKWLKEFFDVNMIVSNLGAAPFSFQHGTASLDALPSGLSLAPTGTPQKLTQNMPDIPGKGSAEAHWVLRGDAEGYYTPTALYSGTLEPLGSVLHLTAQTATNALHVWGGSALNMIAHVDSTAVLGAPYRVQIELKNVADVPVYNPSIELKNDGKINYIYQPREQLFDGAGAIQPNQSFYTHFYRLAPTFSGTLNTKASFIKKTAGNVDVQSTIVGQTAVPGLPITATRSATGASVTLNWNAPPMGVGQTIDGYEIYFTPNRDAAFPDTPIETTIPSVRTKLITTPQLGNYAVSTIVNGVRTMYHTIYGFVPTGPSAVTAQPRDRSAVVSWTAPVSNGGSPIVGYRITPIDQGVVPHTGPLAPQEFDTTATTQTVTGLTNGNSYTFTVSAINRNGTSVAAATSAPIEAGTPSLTTITAATPTNTGAVLAWNTPASDGGSAITGYTISAFASSNGAAKGSKTAGNVHTFTYAGLTNGTGYTFKVAAINAVGPGTLSASSAAVVAGVPSAPTNVKATPGDKQATLTWARPTSAGGISTTKVAKYLVYINTATTPAKTITNPTTNPATMTTAMTGLTNGTKYKFTVRAVNNKNTTLNGPASTASPDMIAGAPTAPTNVVATPLDTKATLTWARPASAGGISTTKVAKYLVYMNGATTPKATITNPTTNPATMTTTITGLSNTTQYTFTVKAANNKNTTFNSLASTASPAVIAGAPTAPTNVVATPALGGATVTWNAPAATGGGTISKYVVTAVKNGGTTPALTITTDQTTMVGGQVSTNVQLTGLEGGWDYKFSVLAVNAGSRNGLSSATTSEARIGVKPRAPTTVTATPGTAQATVAWDPPLPTGFVLTQYAITPYLAGVAGTPVIVADAAAVQGIISGLIHSGIYAFTIHAVNVWGAGSESDLTADITTN